MTVTAAEEPFSAIRLGVSDIHALAHLALCAQGFSESNADAIAEAVTACERDGAAAHGLLRVPTYIRAAASGRINVRAVPTVADGNATQLVVDGEGGFAATAVHATRHAVAVRATETGFALVSFRNSHHLHALWWDVEPLAERALVALALVASRPVMSVFGGSGRGLGTNPLALSCPRAGDAPLTIDMAASTVSRGEIGIAARTGRRIPLGWGLDPEGRPTTDPQAALAGTQLPFSDSPKAAAIALAVELLAVGLSGGSFGFEAVRETIADDGPLRTGSVIIAFEPTSLGASRYAERVAQLANFLLRQGCSRLPGDRRHAHRAAALATGVDVPSVLVDELRLLARG